MKKCVLFSSYQSQNPYLRIQQYLTLSNVLLVLHVEYRLLSEESQERCTNLTITRILSKLLNLKTLWFLICTNLFPLAHKLVQTVRWLVGPWSLSNTQEKRTLRIKPTLRLRVKWDFIQYALTLLIVGRFISNKKMYFILCLFFFG